MTEAPDNVETIFEEFGIQGYERSPEVGNLATALWQARKKIQGHERYAKWVFDTDNGRRLNARILEDYMTPAGGKNDT